MTEAADFCNRGQLPPTEIDRPETDRAETDRADIKRILRTARRDVEKQLARIERARAEGRVQLARHLERLYLHSFPAKLMAAHTANNKLGKGYRVSVDRLLEVAANLDTSVPCAEVAHIDAKPKKSGGYRNITSFGIENRARQYLVKPILEGLVRGRLCPQQYVLRGGRVAAIERVREHVEEGDFKWVIKADVSDCFGSLDPEGLLRLTPLPRTIVENTVLARNLNLYPKPYLFRMYGRYSYPIGAGVHLGEARRGLPQGSALSPLFAELAIAPALDEFPGDVVIVNYADDILIFCRTRRDAQRARIHLEHALRHVPAGPLVARIDAPRRICDGFEFLGYFLQRRRRRRRSRLTTTVKPTRENLVQFWGKFERKLRKLTRLGKVQRPDLEYKLRNYVISWTAAFSAWEGHEMFKKARLYEITLGHLWTEDPRYRCIPSVEMT